MSDQPMPASSAPAPALPAEPPRRRLPRLPLPGLLGLAVILFWLATALFGPWLLSPEANAPGADEVFGRLGAAHPLGTDYLGRDILARLVLGAGYTVGVAIVATLLASAGGTALALLAAVRGGWADGTLSRLMDTLISIPSKLFALIMVAAFGSSVTLLALTAALIYVPGVFRIARSLAVNINAMDYVAVARSRGEGELYIMRHEILPNMLGPMLADLGLRFVYVVLLLAGLSFLGLGVQPPEADWGSLVRENLGGLPEGAPAVIVPALAIASLTIAVNLLIDNLPGRGER
ncbi:ABC transporter permease subunit [Azoarcus indigens]|nr:ABC transporter permease [Azoarcus indigens]NMG67316.1 ABC transporter permease subunit [Azoarcus indigens]